jgi:hypothetical protein
MSPDNPHLRLTFVRDPPSATLTLTDFLQEFERPTAGFGSTSGRGGRNRVAITYGTACSGVEIEISGGTLALRFSMGSKEACAIKRKALTKEGHAYFDPQHGYVDMSSLGISHASLSACL